MATYVIGDIQGCYDALIQLLDKVNFDASKDRLWSVGDLVNRGPQSLEVLRFIKHLGVEHPVVLGNHDLHLLSVACQCQSLQSSDTFQDVLNATDRDELLNWLRQQKLLHYNSEFNVVMAHAGISPQWDLASAQAYAKEVENILRSDQYIELLSHMYGNEPESWHDDLQGWHRYRFIINAFTRMRFCDEQGHLDLITKGPPGTQPHGFAPWFKIKNRKPIQAKIVFGHWASLRGQIDEPNIFAVDTGCCWGESLTALCLEDLKYFSVKCELCSPPL